MKSLSEGAALTMRTLLGDPCPILIDTFGGPTERLFSFDPIICFDIEITFICNFSAQKSILSATYVLQRYWKCLQIFESFTPEQSMTQLQEDNQHCLPTIEFYGNDEKLDKYPTRDICPVQDPKVAEILDGQLDALIKGNHHLGVIFLISQLFF